jgi:lysophospholipase L1-like esterase
MADRAVYLDDLKAQLGARWPDNKTVNVVFHGHSVPAGYARTPVVNTLHAYPHLTLCGLKERYPNAVINVITTAIGGEQSEQGAARFEAEVLTHRPDVLLIDYALNDRTIGLERSEKAWRQMIEAALARGVKVILLTPTPDLSEDILAEGGRLAAHADLIRRLAAEYHVGLADVYKAFRARALAGEIISLYMSQVNHPNALGHSVAAAEILPWFF